MPTVKPPRNLRRLLTIVALILGFLTVATQADAQPEPGATYRLGFIAADTGPLAFAGISYRQGAELAMQEINAAGTLGKDSHVDLLVKEGSEDPAKSIQVYNQFAADRSVLAATCCILTPTAGVLKPVAVAKRVPLICYGATSDGLPAPPMVYNVSSLPTPDEEALASYMVARTKIKTMVYYSPAARMGCRRYHGDLCSACLGLTTTRGFISSSCASSPSAFSCLSMVSLLGPDDPQPSMQTCLSEACSTAKADAAPVVSG